MDIFTLKCRVSRGWRLLYNGRCAKKRVKFFAQLCLVLNFTYNVVNGYVEGNPHFLSVSGFAFDRVGSAFRDVELRGVEVDVISQSGLEGKEAFPFGWSYATRLQPDPFRLSSCPAPAARGTCHKSNRT